MTRQEQVFRYSNLCTSCSKRSLAGRNKQVCVVSILCLRVPVEPQSYESFCYILNRAAMTSLQCHVSISQSFPVGAPDSKPYLTIQPRHYTLAVIKK